MPALVDVRREVVDANRILAHEGILDAFGHVSARHPDHPDRFIMAWGRSPELIEDEDLLDFSLDGQPLESDGRPPYLERFIHAAVYQDRPDVMAVCHSHTLSILPFSIARNVRLRPMMNTAGLLAGEVPVWDMADDFGPNTDLMVRNMEHGKSLSRTLGAGPVALMRGHGSVVAAPEMQTLLFICINLDKNAWVQLYGRLLGDELVPLSDGEIDATVHLASTPSAARAIEYWRRRASC